MSNYVKLATDAGDQFLTSLAEMQENYLKTAAAFAAKFTAPAMPMEVPAFASTVPTPAEVTEASFAFAQKLLKQQKNFAEKLLAASAPAAK